MKTSLIHSISVEYQFIQPNTLQHPDLIVVFLHEALGSIRQFKSFPNILCERIGALGLVYNRQGHGASTPLKEKRTAKYLHHYADDELNGVIDALCPNKKIILVGHSDGGSIALLHARKSKQSIIGCVTIAAHVINEDITKDGIIRAIEAYKEGKLKKLEQFHFSQTDNLVKAWYETWLATDFSDWNICQEIEKITCPVLALQGEQDQYGSISQLALMKQHIPNCTVQLVASCGHHPHLEREDQLIQYITDWINSYLTNNHSFSVDSDATNL